MSKQWVATLALCMAMAVGGAFGVMAGKQTQLPASELQKNIQAPTPHTQAQYRLTGQEGKLAVYIIGKKEPEIVFDIYLNHLPDIDRQKLEEGIEVEEYAELLRLLEDYTS